MVSMTAEADVKELVLREKTLLKRSLLLLADCGSLDIGP